MRCRFSVALFVAIGVLGLADRAYPCAAVRATARIDTFSCPGCEGSLETQIYSVSGTAVISNGRATPVLGSLVVELQAREGNSVYFPVGRQVINAFGASSVNTCGGALSAGPYPGRVVFVDTNGNEVSFDAVKNIPEGTTALMFVATFVGTIPELSPGERARVKVYTTAKGVDAPFTCSIDADGDGSVDADVKTLTFQKTARVPTTSFVVTSP